MNEKKNRTTLPKLSTKFHNKERACMYFMINTNTGTHAAFKV
jgi:hypothetical protein